MANGTVILTWRDLNFKCCGKGWVPEKMGEDGLQNTGGRLGGRAPSLVQELGREWYRCR